MRAKHLCVYEAPPRTPRVRRIPDRMRQAPEAQNKQAQNAFTASPGRRRIATRKNRGPAIVKQEKPARGAARASGPCVSTAAWLSSRCSEARQTPSQTAHRAIRATAQVPKAVTQNVATRCVCVLSRWRPPTDALLSPPFAWLRIPQSFVT